MCKCFVHTGVRLYYAWDYIHENVYPSKYWDSLPATSDNFEQALRTKPSWSPTSPPALPSRSSWTSLSWTPWTPRSPPWSPCKGAKDGELAVNDCNVQQIRQIQNLAYTISVFSRAHHEKLGQILFSFHGQLRQLLLCLRGTPVSVWP